MGKRIAGDRLIEIIWNYQTLLPRSLLKNALYPLLLSRSLAFSPPRHRYCIVWLEKLCKKKKKKFVIKIRILKFERKSDELKVFRESDKLSVGM